MGSTNSKREQTMFRDCSTINQEDTLYTLQPKPNSSKWTYELKGQDSGREWKVVFNRQYPERQPKIVVKNGNQLLLPNWNNQVESPLAHSLYDLVRLTPTNAATSSKVTFWEDPTGYAHECGSSICSTCTKCCKWIAILLVLLIVLVVLIVVITFKFAK